jgi:hypothetical protein
MSSYQRKHKNYYELHKAEILAKERTKKRWLTYYDLHKDAIKQRRDARKLRNVSAATLTAVVPQLEMFFSGPPTDDVVQTPAPANV